MTFLSISAKAAWIWRKARPAGVVVSMGELSARKAMPRRAELVDQGDELGGQAAEAVEVEHDEDVAAARG